MGLIYLVDASSSSSSSGQCQIVNPGLHERVEGSSHLSLLCFIISSVLKPFNRDVASPDETKQGMRREVCVAAE